MLVLLALVAFPDAQKRARPRKSGAGPGPVAAARAAKAAKKAPPKKEAAKKDAGKKEPAKKEIKLEIRATPPPEEPKPPKNLLAEWQRITGVLRDEYYARHPDAAFRSGWPGATELGLGAFGDGSGLRWRNTLGYVRAELARLEVADAPASVRAQVDVLADWVESELLLLDAQALPMCDPASHVRQAARTLQAATEAGWLTPEQRKQEVSQLLAGLPAYLGEARLSLLSPSGPWVDLALCDLDDLEQQIAQLGALLEAPAPETRAGPRRDKPKPVVAEKPWTRAIGDFRDWLLALSAGARSRPPTLDHTEWTRLVELALGKPWDPGEIKARCLRDLARLELAGARQQPARKSGEAAQGKATPGKTTASKPTAPAAPRPARAAAPKSAAPAPGKPAAPASSPGAPATSKPAAPATGKPGVPVADKPAAPGAGKPAAPAGGKATAKKSGESPAPTDKPSGARRKRSKARPEQPLAQQARVAAMRVLEVAHQAHLLPKLGAQPVLEFASEESPCAGLDAIALRAGGPDALYAVLQLPSRAWTTDRTAAREAEFGKTDLLALTTRYGLTGEALFLRARAADESSLASLPVNRAQASAIGLYAQDWIARVDWVENPFAANPRLVRELARQRGLEAARLLAALEIHAEGISVGEAAAGFQRRTGVHEDVALAEALCAERDPLHGIGYLGWIELQALERRLAAVSTPRRGLDSAILLALREPALRASDLAADPAAAVAIER